MFFHTLTTIRLVVLFLLPGIVHGQVSTKIVGTVTILGPTTPPSAQYTDTPTFKNAVLNSSNVFRHQHDAIPLVWNDTLATFAEKPADLCKFAHSGGPYGENLAEGYENVTAAIDFWGYERHLYDFDKGDFDVSWGHFTQLVWKNTTNVGCAVKDCGKENGWILFCEYFPRGNILKQFKDNVQKQSNSDVGFFTISNSTTNSTGGNRGGGTSGKTSDAISWNLNKGCTLSFIMGLALLLWVL